MKRLFLLLLVLGLTFSCAQRQVGTSETGTALPDGRTTAEGRQGGEETPAVIGDREVSAIETREIKEPARPMEVPEEAREKILRDIHFDFDMYDVRDEDKPVLRAIADWMVKNGSATLMIEGHCDERGTNEYNLGLGDRRAKAVKDYLVALGVSASRLQTVSYGEERPLCTESTEECWAKNRRAHFVVLEGEGGK